MRHKINYGKLHMGHTKDRLHETQTPKSNDRLSILHLQSRIFFRIPELVFELLH